LKKFPFVQQRDAMDCGPACLAMIARYYGKVFSLSTLRDRSSLTRIGVSLLGISDAAESIGLRTMGVQIDYNTLKAEAPLPCIVHWQQRHFMVVYGIKKGHVKAADPAGGLLTFTKEEFQRGWISARKQDQDQGVCLLLEPSPDFYKHDDETLEKSGFKYFFTYLRPYKKFLVQLFLGLFLGTVLSLVFPFLTQSIVDKGINNRDIGFVYLILIAQLVLFFSQTAVDFIRNWILLHISARINISLISDFLIKLMKLSIGFFDTKLIGDILQRIDDHQRIESFLTSSTLSTLFSMFNLLVFGLILAVFKWELFAIFMLAGILYVLWVVLFMAKRRRLDFKRFAQLSDNQSSLIQLINGIQEIKLNNCERQKRWGWERIQAKIFKINIQSLTLRQYQATGALFINQFKNILISFLSAKAVIDGHMTLGMMMAVQYIIGQLNSTLDQFIHFFHTAQDAKISLERLAEIHLQKDEQKPDQPQMVQLPARHSIHIRNLSFHYAGSKSEPVLQDLDLLIPERKITAIVGVSGSGKTTLLKLLLGFYPPSKGEIQVGDIPLNHINQRFWRQKCGVVMQDGFVFSDTIIRNIAVGDETIHTAKLLHAAKTAHIQDLIETLPLGYDTKIGMEGHGLSQGQKQRILIARSVYKNPAYLFFDEATNALDARNEAIIMNNLNLFFRGRTVIIVAHRLSTVRNADQIVVLEKGRIIEKGTHGELTSLSGAYFNLVKNQLELGSES